MTLKDKKFRIIVITEYGTQVYEVIAAQVLIRSNPIGYYELIKEDGSLCGLYPMDKTIVEIVENQ